MTYLDVIIELLFIVWSVCSLTVILSKPKDLFKEDIYGGDLTPLTNIWIFLVAIGLGSILIYYLGSNKVFWEK